MRGAMRTFFRSYLGIAALVTVLLLTLLAAFGPVIWGAAAQESNLGQAALGPSAAHWLGTDRLGRDILARTLVATRLTLGLSLAAVGVAAVLGFSFGAVVALLSGHLRNLGQRAIEFGQSFPPILVAIIVTAIIGPGPPGAVLAVGVSFAPNFARLTNTLAANIAGREYVAGARIIGLSPFRVLLRYIIPNIAEQLVMSSFNAVGSALLTISSLSFLGLGVQLPQFDWGRMLTEGVESIYVNPVAALAPTLAIALTGLGAGFLGQAFAQAFNPLLWTYDAADAPVPDSTVAAGGGTQYPPAPITGVAAVSDGGQPSARPVLRVKNLSVRIPSDRGPIRAVSGVTLIIASGEVVGIVGESGCGKTMTALALANLVPYPGQVTADALELEGEPLLTLSRRRRDRRLGRSLAMIFQDPMSSLNPSVRIGTQLAEPGQVHRRLSRRDAYSEAEARLEQVYIPAPAARLRQFAHELSGGMRQRVMIAMGLMNMPALIIADEPTTALDVTVQAQIIDLLKEVNQSRRTAIILISHDIGVVTELCERVLVMYAGRIVEDTSVGQLLAAPAHPYTAALMAAIPDLETDRSRRLATIPGRPPDLAALPPGCPYAARCPLAEPRCYLERPPLVERSAGHLVACWVNSAPVPREPYGHV